MPYGQFALLGDRLYRYFLSDRYTHELLCTSLLPAGQSARPKRRWHAYNGIPGYIEQHSLEEMIDVMLAVGRQILEYMEGGKTEGRQGRIGSRQIAPDRNDLVTRSRGRRS